MSDKRLDATTTTSHRCAVDTPILRKLLINVAIGGHPSPTTMKIRTKKRALVCGAMLFALGGAAEVACSDNSNPGASTPVTPTPDSGPTTNTEAGADGASVDAAGGQDSATPTCKAPSLHATPAGEVFCGYNDAGSFSCTADAGMGQCCLGGSLGSKTFAPEQCQAFGSACTNPVGKGSPIECGQVSDCAANGVANAACCLQGAMGAPAPETGCASDDLKLSGGTGIMCEAATTAAPDGSAPACSSGLQICSQNLDCPAGMTCTPMHWKLYQLGFCK